MSASVQASASVPASVYQPPHHCQSPSGAAAPPAVRRALTVVVVDVAVALSVGRSGAADGERRAGRVEVGHRPADVGVADVEAAARLRVLAHLLQDHHAGRLRDLALACRHTRGRRRSGGGRWAGRGAVAHSQRHGTVKRSAPPNRDRTGSLSVSHPDRETEEHDVSGCALQKSYRRMCISPHSRESYTRGRRCKYVRIIPRVVPRPAQCRLTVSRINIIRNRRRGGNKAGGGLRPVARRSEDDANRARRRHQDCDVTGRGAVFRRPRSRTDEE